MNQATRLFRAVSIEPDKRACCAAVQQQMGTRYLCNEAPLLPLPDCSRQTQCRCKYRHWDDRRQEDRRALATGIANQYFDGTERRVLSDRRSG